MTRKFLWMFLLAAFASAEVDAQNTEFYETTDDDFEDDTSIEGTDYGEIFDDYLDDKMRDVNVDQDIAIKACVSNSEALVKKIDASYNKCFKDFEDWNEFQENNVGNDEDKDGLTDKYEEKEACFYRDLGWVVNDKANKEAIKKDLKNLNSKSIKDEFITSIEACADWNGKFRERKKRDAEEETWALSLARERREAHNGNGKENGKVTKRRKGKGKNGKGNGNVTKRRKGKGKTGNGKGNGRVTERRKRKGRNGNGKGKGNGKVTKRRKAKGRNVKGNGKGTKRRKGKGKNGNGKITKRRKGKGRNGNGKGNGKVTKRRKRKGRNGNGKGKGNGKVTKRRKAKGRNVNRKGNGKGTKRRKGKGKNGNGKGNGKVTKGRNGNGKGNGKGTKRRKGKGKNGNGNGKGKSNEKKGNGGKGKGDNKNDNGLTKAEQKTINQLLPDNVYNQLWCYELSLEKALEDCVVGKLLP